jgi:ribosomal protein S18 acetylase RimI-like enzyme
MKYGENFYNTIDPSLSQLAYEVVDGSPAHAVGSICTRVEHGSIAYIMSLAVCPTLHTQGIGSLLLNDMIRKSNKNFQLGGISLHVQTNNEAAINLYTRFGFSIIETIPGFYQRNLDYDVGYHADCHVMHKTLLPWPKRRLAEAELRLAGPKEIK